MTKQEQIFDGLINKMFNLKEPPENIKKGKKRKDVLEYFESLTDEELFDLIRKQRERTD